MRVCLLTTPDLACETGSTLHGRDLAIALGERGHQVDVLCRTLPARATPAVRFHRLPLPLDHPVFVDRTVTSDDLGLSIQLLVQKIGALHAERPFDVVHCHYATFTAAAGAVAWWLHGIPMVLSTFGRDLTIGVVADPRYRRMTQASLRDAKRVIAATPSLAEEVITGFGVAADKVVALPMGIDETLFEPDRDGTALRARADIRGPLVVVIASAFGPEKGIDLLITSLSRAAHGKDLTLWILGSDDEPRQANRRRLEELVGRLGMSKRVVFCGRIPHERMPEYLAAADLVVDPRLSGNHSSSMLEALAMGRPVIGCDVANEWKALEHGVNGLVFPAGDGDRLTACIDGLLADPGARARLAESARAMAKTVADRFRMASVADATSRIYESVRVEARASSG